MANIMTIIIIIFYYNNFSKNGVLWRQRLQKLLNFEFEIWKLQLRGSLMNHAVTEVFNFQIQNSKFKSLEGLWRHKTPILKNNYNYSSKNIYIELCSPIFSFFIYWFLSFFFKQKNSWFIQIVLFIFFSFFHFFICFICFICFIFLICFIFSIFHFFIISFFHFFIFKKCLWQHVQLWSHVRTRNQYIPVSVQSSSQRVGALSLTPTVHWGPISGKAVGGPNTVQHSSIVQKHPT